MSRTPQQAAAIVFALVVAAAATAAEEPEAVYAKYHRAAASGNLEEMLRYSPDAQRAEFVRMSAAQKDAAVKMVTAMMPRAYLLRDKLLSEDGRSARLVVSGPGESAGGEPPATLYGTVRMMSERGEWRIIEARWSMEQPTMFAPMRPAVTGSAAKPVVQAKPAAAATPAARAAPIVGSTTGTPLRKLGTARPPCVYKPVMNAEDMENCR